MYVYSLPIYPSSTPPFPFGICKFFSVYVSPYFGNKLICIFSFLDSTYKWYHVVFIFLCLAYFSWYNNF